MNEMNVLSTYAAVSLLDGALGALAGSLLLLLLSLEHSK